MKRAGFIAVGIAMLLGLAEERFQHARGAVAAISAHLVLIIVALAVGLPAVTVAAIAMIKGAEKHTVQAWDGPARVLRMPAPAERHAIAAPPAEDEPAAIVTAPAPEEDPCEGPDCAEKLGDAVFEVGVTFEQEPDRPEEVHRFCSSACAQAWQDNDIEQRAPGAVR